MRRALALAALTGLLALPAGAVAQSNPFGPLPPPQQEVPTPTAAPTSSEQSSVSRTLLLGIAGGVALLFVGIGVFISRDARTRLTKSDRHALERRRENTEEHRRKAQRDKAKARARTRAQKRARKQQRR